jgi:hypothetical protein
MGQKFTLVLRTPERTISYEGVRSYINALFYEDLRETVLDLLYRRG